MTAESPKLLEWGEPDMDATMAALLHGVPCTCTSETGCPEERGDDHPCPRCGWLDVYLPCPTLGFGCWPNECECCTPEQVAANRERSEHV